MLRRWVCQADITLQLQPLDPVLIKSGYATLDGPDMVPVSTLRHGQKTYYFPGTSLKGALRSHFERIARTLAPGSVCIPFFDPRKKMQVPVPAEQRSFGCGFRQAGEGRPDSSATAYHEACAACRLFGSLRFAGRLSIGDAYPVPGHLPKLGVRNGVGIDRFTGGTVPGVLFDLAVVEGGLFETTLRVTNFELWQLAVVNFLLADLQDELIAFGSCRSRGMGRVQGKVTRYLLSYPMAVPRLVGLAELASDEECQAYRLFSWQPPEEVSLPSPKMAGLRRQYDLSEDWQQRLAPLADSVAAFLQWHQPLGAVENGKR